MECVLRMEEEEANGKANQVSLLLKVVVIFCVFAYSLGTGIEEGSKGSKADFRNELWNWLCHT